MKQLTYSAMAVARFRANRRQYMSLVLGIFLAIFLVTTVFLTAQGFLLAQLERTEQRVGRLDAFLLDDPDVTDESLAKFARIQQIGHVYVMAMLEGTETCVGWYSETGTEHVVPSLLEGRIPEAHGEIAIEQGTLLSLDLDRNWKLGDTVELSLVPVDGEPERRSFTLVGILRDRSTNLVDSYGSYTTMHGEYVKHFPALLVSEREAPFYSGRIAVHRTFLLHGGKWANPCVNRFYEAVSAPHGRFYCISAFGHVGDADESWPMFLSEDTVVIPLLVGGLLATALIISCCVGIAGAMEGALSRRSEEIGLLRAVGATKKQIRRIFGRESLLMSCLVAPASMLVSTAVVGVLSWIAPEQMVLKLNPVLLLPIAIISMAMIIISGYLPLRRCSGLMPMSIIRDTAVLRKQLRIRSKKQFRVSRLISGRHLRLHPSRQLGSTVLTALMLFCAVCAAVCVNVGKLDLTAESGAFEIMIPNGLSTEYVDFLTNPPLSDQSLAQIKRLPHVADVRIDRNVDISVLLEEKCEYLKSDNHAFYTEEEYLEKVWVDKGSVTQEMVDFAVSLWRTGVEDYNQVRDYLGVEQELVRLNISTVVLDEATLLKLSGWLEAGKIDVDAINAGREVIVAAPNRWTGEDSRGRGYGYSGPVQRNPQDRLTAYNDCFYPGQELPMIQLYCETEEYTSKFALEEASRRDATVTVGAVLNRYDWAMWYTAVILTTEEGLQNMGLYANGYDWYRVYLDGNIDEQTEELLMQRLDAIASRSGNYSLTNMLQRDRENRSARKQLVTVFAAIAILFGAVTVGMIVSSITRQIQSDGRRIGMLRAVGADEKTILRCYTGQVAVSIFGGFILTTLLLLLILCAGIVEGLERYVGYGYAAMIVLSVFSGAACWYILRLRIRNIISKSIIDNIREL